MRRSRRDDYDDEDLAAFDGRPRRRPRRRAMSRGRLLVGLIAAAGFAAVIAAPNGAPAPPAATKTRAAWVDTGKSDELFALPAAAVSGLALNYAIDRPASGLGRQDVLTFGRPGGESGYVRLEIRHAMAPGADAGLFVALVRRAADAGLAVTRAGQSFTLATRLGPLEASAVTLAADAHEWPCLGMRLRSTDTRLTIVGLSCGEAGKRPTPAATACMLDALGLAPGSEDASLRSFFEEAARRRGSACQAPGSAPTRNAPPRSAGKTPSAKSTPVKSTSVQSTSAKGAAAKARVSLDAAPAASAPGAVPTHRAGARARTETIM